jgi:hypothetical protein
VTVSSSANYLTNGLDFYAIADGPERTKYSVLELYNKSKFVRRTESLLIGLFVYTTCSQGNVVVAKELARRYGDKIVCTSLHPGNIRTGLQRHMSGWQNTLLVRSFTFSGRHLLTLHSTGRCILHHTEHSPSYTVQRRRLRRMPTESFSFRGHEPVSRIRLLWILDLERGCGLGLRTRRRT